ncbi:MAG: LamG domain-containing protein [Kiritimatiellae bacterium]|nr:LamG domain-containing protein [Kiritimatiellia bacterium]
MRTRLLSALGLGFALSLVAPAWGVTHYVWTNSPSEASPYTNWATAAHVIQDAVDVAAANDDVLVTNGVYNTGGCARDGLTHINRVYVTNAITVRSVNGPHQTIIWGNGARGAYLVAGSVLAGFTLTNCTSDSYWPADPDTSGGGVLAASSDAVVSNCMIVKNYAYGQGGGVAKATAVNCLIKHNVGREYAGGVYNGKAYNCNIVSNNAGSMGGAWMNGYYYNCIVWGNTAPTDPNGRGGLAYTCCYSDPAFEADSDRLSMSSPCINAGDNSYVLTGDDLDGCPRVAGSTVDVGCYEYPQDAGNALYSDGTDGGCRMADSPDLDTELGSNMTIEVWFRTSTLASRIIVGKHWSGTDGSYYLATLSDGQMRFALINSTEGRVDLDVPASYADGHWHHVAGVYDGEQMTIYFDGTATGSPLPQSGAVKDSVYDLVVGGYAGTGWIFAGDMDEARVWSAARTADQIRDNMHKHLLGSESDLVAYFRLSQVTGTSVPDWADRTRAAVVCSGTVWTHSEAPLGNSEMVQQHALRAAWAGAATRAADGGTGLGLSSEFGTGAESVFWGHNAASGVEAAALPAGGPGDGLRTSREWRLLDSGSHTGIVTVSLSSVDAGPMAGADAEDYWLLWRLNAGSAFSLVTNASSRSGSEIAFNSAAFSNGYYAASVPGPLATGPATNIYPVRAEVQGTVWGWAGVVTNITFEYGTNTDYGLCADASPYGYDGTNSCEVSASLESLGPGLTYHYRLSGTLSNTPVTAADRTFDTASITLETGNATTVQLWQATVEGIINTGNESATNLYFEYGFDTNTYGYVVPAAPDAVTSTNDVTVSADIAVLAAGTRHYYRLCAMFGPMLACAEPESFVAPVAAPVALDPVAHCYYGFDAAWQAVTGATNYLLDVSTNDNFSTWFDVYQNLGVGTSTTCAVTGIVEGVTYYYRVSGQFPEANSGESDVISVCHPVSPIHYVMPGGANEMPYADWATAASTVQAAVDMAMAGDIVLLTNGVYDTGGNAGGGGQTNRVTMHRGVTIMGAGDRDATIIVGAPDGDTAGCGPGAVRCVWMARDCALCNVTLSNGYTTSSGDFYYRSGGGVSSMGWDIVLSNVAVAACCAHYCGGGVYGYAGTAIYDSLITGNSCISNGGGIVAAWASNTVLTGNTALNGGAGSSASFEDCVLSGNTATERGGGAHASQLSYSEVSMNEAIEGGGLAECDTAWSCVILSNLADMGGGTYAGTPEACVISYNEGALGGGAYGGTLDDCVLFENFAWRGGGAYQSTLWHGTVVSNEADRSGGVYGGAVNNSIVYYNRASESTNWSSTAFSYSCTLPLPEGAGNITNPPMFVDVAAADFHPLPGSPCVDAANPGSYGNDDFAWVPRPLDGNNDGTNAPDMGAYEYVHPSADSDGDTMLDTWEIGYPELLDPTWAGDADDDDDGDGVTNAAEFVADTDPLDSNSFFRIISMSITGSCAVAVPCSSERIYELQCRESLLSGEWYGVEGQTNLPGDAGGTLWLVDTNDLPVRYHRAGVSLP